MRAKSAYEAHCESWRIAELGARDLRLVKVWEDPAEPKLSRYMLRGNRSWLWVEVVVLHHGHLLVHGDIEAVIFGICSGYSHAREVLYWMADAGPGYAREKASIGSSGKITEEWDADVALSYVNHWEKEEQITAEAAHDLRQVLEHMPTQDEFFQQVCATDGLDCDDYSAGIVTSQAVFSAQASLRVLVRELENRDARDAARAWYRRSA